MSWAWLAVVDEPPEGVDAAARLRTLAAEPAGVLAAWTRRARPGREAGRGGGARRPGRFRGLAGRGARVMAAVREFAAMVGMLDSEPAPST